MKSLLDGVVVGVDERASMQCFDPNCVHFPFAACILVVKLLRSENKIK